MDIRELKAMDVTDLVKVATGLEVEGVGGMRRQELHFHMTSGELRDRLIASVTRRFRDNDDLELHEYIFSNSLFHSIAREQVEFMFDQRADKESHEYRRHEAV